MTSTYTDNIGVEKPETGDQVGTWGITDNLNYDIVDQAISGYVSVTLGSAGSSGSPNDFDITDGTLSDGRNPFISFTDAGDLGADVFVRLTSNAHKKIGWIENNLSGNQDLFVFQGTYSASNDVVIPAGQKALLRFDGGGTGAVVTNVLSDAIGVGASWTLQNSSTTAVLGRKYLATSHSGIALTMPVAFEAPSSGRQSVWVANVDTNSDITLTPGSGDSFYVIGADQSADTTLALKPGELAILTPRTADDEWDVVILLMRQADGDLSIPVGNLVVGTAGKGVDFSANTGTAATGAATTSELFDFYEEGTWTPVLWDSSLSSGEGQTYTFQSGQFTRIGNLVHIRGTLTVDSLGSLTTSSAAIIGNLPFTSAGSNHHSGVLVHHYSFINGSGGGDPIIGRITESKNYIVLAKHTGLEVPADFAISNFNATNPSISFYGTYWV